MTDVDKDYSFYPREGERYFVEAFQKETGEYPAYSVLALFSLAFGIKHVKEFAAGTVGGVIQHFVADGEGVDGMVSCLAGVQIHKRRYTTAAFPVLLETWKGLRDFQKGKALSKQNISRNGLFLLGFLMSYFKYV